MNSLIIIVVIANCAFASNLPKIRVKRQWSGDLGHAINTHNNTGAIQLIESGANPAGVDGYGQSQLHYAAKYNNEILAEYIIKKGNAMLINVKDMWGDTPLHESAAKGNLNIVKLFLDNGGNINGKNNYGKTPLIWATENRQDKTVELLLKYGADINIKNNEGKTARDIAVEKGHTEIVTYLDTASALLKVNEVCDKYSVPLPSDFIAHGRPVKPEELPWMAALGYLDFSAYRGISFKCGGTVISERFVLTAAHCANPDQPPVVVRLGNIYLADRGSRNYYIKDIIRHESYSSEFKRNDIALLRLVKEIVFTPDIRPACLETNLHDQDSSVKLIVSGWGTTTSLDTDTSDKLLKAEVRTIPLSECNSTYLEYNKKAQSKAFKNGITQSQYCANDPIGKSDSCHGDSGGPLQIFHNSHTAHIVGIVSFGVSCGTRLPTIYTRVAYYVNWIHSHVWN